MSVNLKSSALFDITGWVCVVTGGGSGLGKMMATCLAQNGAKVYITGRRFEKLQETASDFTDRIFPIAADSTKKEDIKKMVNYISQKEDHVDLLINNSGVSTRKTDLDADFSPEGISKRMLEQDFDEWTSPYSINVAAIYFTTAALLPLLVATKKRRDESGNVINVTSVSGIIKNSQNGQFSYNSNKAAAVSLSQQLSLELARPHIGIRVNQLALGYFPSEMSPILPGNQKAEYQQKWQIPAGRPGNAADLSKVILNLATNGYMSGSTETVDGAYILASDNLNLSKYV